MNSSNSSATSFSNTSQHYKSSALGPKPSKGKCTSPARTSSVTPTCIARPSSRRFSGISWLQRTKKSAHPISCRMMSQKWRGKSILERIMSMSHSISWRLIKLVSQRGISILRERFMRMLWRRWLVRFIMLRGSLSIARNYCMRLMF